MPEVLVLVAALGSFAGFLAVLAAISGTVSSSIKWWVLAAMANALAAACLWTIRIFL